MVTRVSVQPELFTWAANRSRISREEIIRRFPKFEDWEADASAPTFKQLEDFAEYTYTPIGFFFLPEPPQEDLPLPDFRTIRDEEVGQPSANLLDTIFQVQQRQEWYREYARAVGEEPVVLVGSFSVKTPITTAADSMRSALSFGLQERGPSWGEAFRRLAENAEDLGILVMVNGIVGNNTHRKLDPNEFRGFALLDEYAPVVFVNGADTKAAQIFTLVHELAHIWLGQSALTDANESAAPKNKIERWCNQVAAEMLVPLDTLRHLYERENTNIHDELDRLARRFKVSTLVILRRIREAGFLEQGRYRAIYQAELDRVMTFLESPGGSGGNFYNTQAVRTGKRFARAVVTSTLEGQTLYRDAFRMLGFRKTSTFNEFAHRLEVV